MQVMRGEELRKWREGRGMTQGQVAEAMGASRRSVVTWEKPGGRVPYGQLSALEKLMGPAAVAPDPPPAVEIGPEQEMAALVGEHGVVPCLAALAKAALPR